MKNLKFKGHLILPKEFIEKNPDINPNIVIPCLGVFQDNFIMVDKEENKDVFDLNIFENHASPDDSYVIWEAENILLGLSVKDIENNQIFEGDIVQDIKSETKFLVSWIPEYESFSFIKLDKETLAFPKKSKFGINTYPTVKIIGNIFEEEII